MVAAFELEPQISASRMSRVFDTKVETTGRQLAALQPIPRNNFAFKTEGYLPFESFPTVTAYLEQPSIVFSPELFQQQLDRLLEPAGRPMRRRAFRDPDAA